MKLSEIFDSDVDLQWQINGRFILTSFTANGIPYLIQIEKKPLYFDELKDKKTAEVSFARNDIEDTEKAHSTAKSSNFSAPTYGVVANALTKKFEDFDAFYFTANRRHSSSQDEFQSKANIYGILGNRIAKKTGAFFYEGKEGADSVFLVSRIKVEKPGLVIEAEEARKQYNLTGVPIELKR